MRSGSKDFRRRIALYLRLSIALTLLFIVTYGSTNWLASRRADHFRLYFDWELAIPFVPWMIYVYLSINFFLALPVLVLNTDEIRRFAKAFALVTLTAACLHLLFPTELGWKRPAHVPGYPVFERLYEVALPHNLVPSLHITYAVLTTAVVWNHPRLRILAGVWLALLALSVLLVHQHHLLDVAAGATLGLIGYRWFSK